MNDKSSLLRTLHDLAEIKPDVESTRNAIEQARLAVLQQKFAVRTSFYWRKIMSPLNIKVAIISLAAILLLAFWLVPSGSTESLAFADFQGQVEKVKSVQYVQTVQHKTPKGDQAGTKEEFRVMILGRYLKRTQTKIIQASNWSGLAEGISIEDLETGKSIFLDPKKKLFSVSKYTFSINLDDHSVKKTENKPHPEVDFYQNIRRIPTDKADKLLERIIDGKKTIGFRIEDKYKRKQGTSTSIITYWIDPQTKLPILSSNE